MQNFNHNLRRRTMRDMRSDFPILSRQQNGQEIVYLDNAATTQKPEAVIDAISNYYRMHNANVHRAAHRLAEEATALLEEARQLTQSFIGAERVEEIIFTRGATEAINLVTQILDGRLNAGDQILLTELEHHSNIVPWQMLAKRCGASIEAVKVTPDGELDIADFYQKLSSKTKIFSCNHVSNALGTVNPITELVQAARSAGAITLVDGAQATLHQHLDMQALGCDFYTFSGHKMYAPTGIGVLYGRAELLETLPPWHGGGEMIEQVTMTTSTYQKAPYKFEAGTPNICGAVGLGAAIKYLRQLPINDLVADENRILAETIGEMQDLPNIQLIGTPKNRSAVISFVVNGAHHHDVGTLLNEQGVAVRTGHHCAMPLMQALQIPGTVRASFSLYNTKADADRFIAALQKTITFL
ncbi:MAG: SufS family cysteine desulfurase [Gammaproteobacteria bacterium]|nr:SufS family cysteine desulfurase [Gammaproteobacteria bacterium]